MTRPIGYFVHHQGRGHAERAGAIANALANHRPVTLFCACSDIFPELDPRVALIRIDSLFEPPEGAPSIAGTHTTPDTLHCAPLGWPTITRSVATITRWFVDRSPALFVTDVSAELGQLARIASVPHVAVLQHGDRRDAGHMAAYRSAVGLLAPYDHALERNDRPADLVAKTYYAGGVGITAAPPSREDARRALDLAQDTDLVVVIAGGGGGGTPATPITLGARDEPGSQWVTIGSVSREWHETPPANLTHRGWVDRPDLWIAAADRVVSSAGNTTVHMVLAIGRPWVVVPEWRYFDEQLCKARALSAAGVAAVREHWPAHAAAWRSAWNDARAIDLAAQRRLVDPAAALRTAAWLDDLASAIWATGAPAPRVDSVAEFG